MQFVVHTLRFTLEARDPIHFPEGKAGNVLRGALGHALDEDIFRPTRCEGPSGLSNPPRPFVLRVRALDGRTFGSGQQFPVVMNLFEADASSAGRIAAAVGEIAEQGIGPGRGRAQLIATDAKATTIELSETNTGAVHAAGILFLTPTEIKGRDGQLVSEPEFGVLMSRIRDRISTLRTLYGPGPLEIDFRAFAQRASSVRMTSSSLRHVAIERTSSRTGQRHPLGGFTGDAAYEGDLTEFLPYLRAASLTGVGRQTVWGKGEIACHSWNGSHLAEASV